MADIYDFESAAKAAGWDADSQVATLLQYIRNQQSDAAFLDYLQTQVKQEAELAEPELPVTPLTFTVTVERPLTIWERGSLEVQARTPQEALGLAMAEDMPSNMKEINGSADAGEATYSVEHNGELYTG